MSVKKILIPIIVLLVIGAIVFIAVWFSTRGGTSKDLGQYKARQLHSYNWCGNRKVIALTFDDGPDVATTPTLLADLKRHNVKATFFMSPAVNGPPSAQQCSLVKTVLEHGHSVQSHSFDHTNFADKDAQSIMNSLRENHEWLEKCADGERLSLNQFRPPFGSLDTQRAKFISDLGYTIASWNVESMDYSGGNADTVFQNVRTSLAEHDCVHPIANRILYDAHYRF